MDALDEEVIERGRRNEALYRLVKRVHDISEYEWTEKRKLKLFEEWYRRLLLSDAKDKEYDYNMKQFNIAWDWVDEGKVPLERLLYEAEEVILPSNNLKPRLQKLLRVLIVMQGEYPKFFINQETIGKIIGKGRGAGYKNMKCLIEEGYIEQVYQGSSVSKKANEYRLLSKSYLPS